MVSVIQLHKTQNPKNVYFSPFLHFGPLFWPLNPLKLYRNMYLNNMCINLGKMNHFKTNFTSDTWFLSNIKNKNLKKWTFLELFHILGSLFGP